VFPDAVIAATGLSTIGKLDGRETATGPDATMRTKICAGVSSPVSNSTWRNAARCGDDRDDFITDQPRAPPGRSRSGVDDQPDSGPGASANGLAISLDDFLGIAEYHHRLRM